MVLGAFISKEHYKQILDVGTGTGVLALMAKQLNPSATITAIDIDKQSEIDCKLNFQNSKWSRDLHYINASIFEFQPPKLFDCIISNPPYYEDGLLSEKQEVNSAKHTANFDLKSFFEVCKNLLCSNGEMWTIIPSNNSSKWIKYTTSIGLFPKTIISVFGKPNQIKRTIIHFSKGECQPKILEFIIRLESNEYTNQYKELTKEFHSKPL